MITRQRILKFLEKLRAYPEETRRAIGLSVSGVLTFFIVSFTFLIPGPAKIEAVESIPKADTPSPFFMIKKQVTDSISEVIQQVQRLPMPKLSDFTASSSKKTPDQSKEISNASSTAEIIGEVKGASTTTTSVIEKPPEKETPQKIPIEEKPIVDPLPPVEPTTIPVNESMPNTETATSSQESTGFSDEELSGI